MFNMLRLFLVALTLLAGASSMAESEVNFDVCSKLESYSVCQDTKGACSWDFESFTCNSNYEVQHGCRHLSRRECFRSPHCFWSHGHCHRNHH